MLTRLVRQQAKNLTLTAIAAYQSFQFLTSSAIQGSFTSSSRLQTQRVAKCELRIPLENSNADSMTAIFQDTFVNCQRFSSKLRSTAQCRVQGPTQSRIVVVAFALQAHAELKPSETQLLVELGFRPRSF